MTSWKTPTTEQVSKAIALLGHAEQVRYFFDRLENPNWILPLRKREFFDRPPQISRDEKGWARFPVWPASRYLARVASRSPDPRTVMDVVLHIANTGTENVRVQEDLIETAINLPGEFAAGLVPKALEWLNQSYHLRLHDKLGALMGHLACEGRGEEAFTLARSLFEVLPASETDGRAYEEKAYPFQKHASSRIAITDYESILRQHLKSLVDAVGLRIFELFCNLLDIAVRESLSGDDDSSDDYSYIWRPAIEEHQQNQHRGLRSLLVSAMRDAGEQISAAHPEQVRSLIRNLEARPRRIFYRVALHLMRMFPESVRDLIAARLTDRPLFEDSHVRHEYVMLLTEQFGQLDLPSQATIFSWIEAGPQDADDRAAAWEQRTGLHPAPEQIENYRKTWQLKRLTPIRDSLPPSWQDRYQRLLSELGEPEHPEFSSYMPRVSVGPRSPKSVDDLKRLSPAELRRDLETWQPPEEQLGMPPSPEGLGREITAMVAAEPERYTPEARIFEGLDPTYVRAFLQGVREATGADKLLPWEPVLDLCQWVMDQPRTIEGRRVDRWSADPDWGWTRKSIADLLKAGFRKGEASVPFALRERVWQLLIALTQDPDPDAADDAEYQGSDPGRHLQHAINTVRGSAMEGIVEYALWVRRYLENLPDGQERLTRGFQEMADVQDILDTHLDPARDPSLAIRAVYGQWFPWLVLLDPRWAAQAVGRIFPTDGPDHWIAAWDSYISFNEPYNDPFNLLLDQYAQAIEQLGGASDDRRHRDERLAQHLMSFYWRGKVNLEDPDGLLIKFYGKADDSICAEAIEFVGRSLQNTPGAVESEVLTRATMLWSWRLDQARAVPAAHQKELSAFGWWVASEKFDDGWAISQLTEVLKLTGKVEADFVVIERLVVLAEAMPREVLECVRLMIVGDQEGWDLYSWEPHLRTILGTAIRNSSLPVQQLAQEIINLLGTRGHFGYRDLLRS